MFMSFRPRAFTDSDRDDNNGFRIRCRNTMFRKLLGSFRGHNGTTVLNNIFIGLGGKAMITGGAGWEGTRTDSAEDLHDVGYGFDGEPSRSGTVRGRPSEKNNGIRLICCCRYTGLTAYMICISSEASEELNDRSRPSEDSHDLG